MTPKIQVPGRYRPMVRDKEITSYPRPSWFLILLVWCLSMTTIWYLSFQDIIYIVERPVMMWPYSAVAIRNSWLPCACRIYEVNSLHRTIWDKSKLMQPPSYAPGMSTRGETFTTCRSSHRCSWSSLLTSPQASVHAVG
jgi:hypothetical protein